MWEFIAYLVISLLINYALAPKPKSQDAAKPASLGEFDVPTAEQGRKIPVAFGEVMIKSPNVVWYGDLRVDPITKSSGGK